MSDYRNSSSSSNPTYLIMKYRDRSVAIKRDPDYQNTIRLVQNSISRLRPSDARNIILFTTLPGCEGALVQISESVWPDIISEVKFVEITLDGDDVAPPTITGAGTGSTAQIARDRAEITPADSTIRAIAVTLRTPSLKLVKFKGLHSSTTVRDVKFLIETRYGIPAALQKLCLFNILPSSKIVDVLVQARKSMIYLLPGSSQSSRGLSYSNVEVQVSLNRSWELANLRPATEKELEDYFQSASWVVDVSGDGILLERGSKAELTYLFWDGMTSPVQTSPSLAPSRSLNQLANTPLSRDWLRLAPLLDPRNSVAVPLVDIETYVSDVFYEFGFADYTPRLTTFISSIKESPDPYLAIRFVPETECKTISSLCTRPPTEYTARVLVLYKGLKAATAGIWDGPRPNYAQGPGVWRNICGTTPLGHDSIAPCLNVVEISWMEVG
ncbi:hypothetical protein FRC07_002331 [Ceratobasidium sp. 392]|nr:hypothetical protein FRC07_002331 [Ceratobasidium sp. 392]